MFNFTATNLSAMPYAQAKILRFEDGTVQLMSYATVVATVDRDGWLEIHGLYSMTTRKHIGAFMREVVHMDFATAKQLYNDGYRMNIHTGEVIAID
jgi:hypothetical protein